MRNYSPLMWNGASPVKPSWSPPTTGDLESQTLSGLRDLSVMGKAIAVSLFKYIAPVYIFLTLSVVTYENIKETEAQSV